MLSFWILILIFFFLVVHRAKWLKEPNPEAEELFRMVAEIFIFWAKSHVNQISLSLIHAHTHTHTQHII